MVSFLTHHIFTIHFSNFRSCCTLMFMSEKGKRKQLWREKPFWKERKVFFEMEKNNNKKNSKPKISDIRDNLCVNNNPRTHNKRKSNILQKKKEEENKTKYVAASMFQCSFWV